MQSRDSLLVSPDALIWRQPIDNAQDSFMWWQLLNYVCFCCAVQLLMLTSSEAIMGPCFANRVSTKVATWAVAIAILSINGSLLYDFGVKELPTHWTARIGFIAGILFYVGLVVYFGIGPHR